MAIDPWSFPKPQQPVFAHPAEERAHNKRVAAAAFRLFYKAGFEEGVMGHLSFRDPEFPDQFWLNPFSVSFNHIRASDLLRVSLEDGRLLEGQGYQHPGGIPLHAAIYAECPEVKAVAHTHSPYGKAFSTLGVPLAPISTEAAVFYEGHSLYDSFAHGEGIQLGKAAKGNKAVIMKTHGILTVGSTVEETAYLFFSLEKVCKEQLLVRAVTDQPELVPPQHARRIAAFSGPYQGWLNFQPTYQAILRDQPDLVD